MIKDRERDPECRLSTKSSPVAPHGRKAIKEIKDEWI
jgi:hypothetical protein